MISEPVTVVAVSGGRLLCEWKEIGFDSSKIRLAWLDPVTEPAAATRSEAVAMPPDGVSSPTPGDVVFYDDFSAETTERWQITSGVWTVVSGVLIGVEPASQTEFVCYARVEEPEKYVLTGRFKFDPISHFAAQLYFRWDPAKGTYYQITNRFRFGVWMGLRDVATKDPVSASQFSSRPLVQRRFPFQNNRWYEFSLVVAPERIDYFVDGRQMFSHTERLKLQTGRFGIGGVSQSPTYFDDIAIAKPAIR